MSLKIENINTSILQQCREQLGIDISYVEGKVKKIRDIEDGEWSPTLKQLDTLAELYRVPRWVFLSEELPAEYSFDSINPSFRTFNSTNPEVFSDYKIRSVVAKVERYRNLILELNDDMGEPIADFDAPDIPRGASPEDTAQIVRTWLGTSDQHLEYDELKLKLEEKGIFIFQTSKYKGWSHIDLELFRGLSIYYDQLPIIIINDSDSRKAKSFTLFHELGHILLRETSIDSWNNLSESKERWCDHLAGCYLLPANEIIPEIRSEVNQKVLKALARKFKASPYACLVRLSQLSVIDNNTFNQLREELMAEYAKVKEILKGKDGGPTRNRSKEVVDQYGHIYSTTLFQAFHNKEVGLMKMTNLFGLKSASQVLEIESRL